MHLIRYPYINIQPFLCLVLIYLPKYQCLTLISSKLCTTGTILLVLLTNSKGNADGTFETNVVVLWNW